MNPNTLAPENDMCPIPPTATVTVTATPDAAARTPTVTQISTAKSPSESAAVVDPRLLGPGGAPTRATTLAVGAAERKQYPIASGVLDYFPDAIVALAHLSYVSNEQHNPGQSLRWNRAKSGDEADTLLRHFLQRGLLDADGIRHTAKVAWRALAMLQKEIEGEGTAR